MLKKEPDEEYSIPVIDCPSCGEKDVVLHIVGPFTNLEGILERIWHCPNCSYVPVFEEEVKGYIRLSDFEEIECDSDL